MSEARDAAVILLIMFLFIFLLVVCTDRGTFAWTFDGVHHVLKIGATQ